MFTLFLFVIKKNKSLFSIFIFTINIDIVAFFILITIKMDNDEDDIDITYYSYNGRITNNRPQLTKYDYTVYNTAYENVLLRQKNDLMFYKNNNVQDIQMFYTILMNNIVANMKNQILNMNTTMKIGIAYVANTANTNLYDIINEIRTKKTDSIFIKHVINTTLTPTNSLNDMNIVIYRKSHIPMKLELTSYDVNDMYKPDDIINSHDIMIFFIVFNGIVLCSIPIRLGFVVEHNDMSGMLKNRYNIPVDIHGNYPSKIILPNHFIIRQNDIYFDRSVNNYEVSKLKLNVEAQANEIDYGPLDQTLLLDYNVNYLFNPDNYQTKSLESFMKYIYDIFYFDILKLKLKTQDLKEFEEKKQIEQDEVKPEKQEEIEEQISPIKKKQKTFNPTNMSFEMSFSELEL
jgi:hypothetical protein